MSEEREAVHEEAYPEARIRRRRRRFSIVWVVPLIAVVVAAVLVYDYVRAWGPQITISFRDAHGVSTGQTQVMYRGIRVGDVTGVELSHDLRQALVKVRLRRSAAGIARAGSVFWIVRPQLGLENVTGLGTVLTGPEIHVQPGEGEHATLFTGREAAPTMVEASGLRVVLRASRIGALRPSAPVYFRGIEVGTVVAVELTKDAAAVDVHAVINKRYAKLVRVNSRFWVVGGVEVNAGLVKGLEFRLESLRSLLVTGISFATPEDGGGPATQGMGFLLYEDPRKEWLEWAPKIALPRGDGPGIAVN